MDYPVESSNMSTKSAPTRLVGEDTAPTTPFHLADAAAVAADYDDDNDLWWDEESSTEGIDVLGESAENFNQWSRYKTGWLVTNRKFKRTVLIMILVSSLTLVFRTLLQQRLYVIADEQPQMETMVVVCSGIVRACQVAFSLELLLEVAHFQARTLTRGWIMIDIAVVVLSWFTSTTVLIFRSFRLLRALRKASRVRVIRTTVKAFLKALPHLLGLAVLFALFLFMFAVLFTDFYLNHLPEEENEENGYTFINMRNSAMTLFEIMTGGRLWGNIANEFADAHPAGPWMLIVFVGTAIFAFGGMAVAIMVHGLMVALSGQDALTWSNVPAHNKKQAAATTSPTTWTGAGSPKSLDGGTAATASMYTFNEVSARQPKDLYRLEQRIDGLSRNVEQILGMQVSLAESVQRLSHWQQTRTEQLQQGTSVPSSTKEDTDI